MKQCKCGSMEFETTMVTVSTVRVTTESGVPKHIPETKKEQPIEFSGDFICVRCKKKYSDVGDANVGKDGNTIQRSCICGSTRFTASQVCYHDIIVDSYNNFHRDIGISESEKPYGPYRCTECGKEYEDLDELDRNKKA